MLQNYVFFNYMGHINELYDFTVSGFLVHPTEKKICMHLHKKFNIWLQFGGHIELDEQPEEALARELKEEAGLEPKDYEVIEAPHPITNDQKSILLPFNINVHKIKGNHKHIDLEYVIKCKTADIKPARGESQNYQWLTLDEIKTKNSDGELNNDILQICEWIFEKFM